MDLASALSFLHPSVVHRDLKVRDLPSLACHRPPAAFMCNDGMRRLGMLTASHLTVLPQPMNILLDSDGTAMLIDFGVSRERDPAHSYFNTRAGGTPAYMAPEMFNGDKFDEKVDVFALACILCECMSCQSPWDGATNFGMIVYTVSIMDERPDIPEDCPDRMRRLINRCWEKDPHGRPSCYEIAHKLKAMIRTEEARIKQEAEKLTRIEDEDPAQDEVRMVMSQASIGTSANSLSSSIPPSPLPLADHRRPPIVER